MIVIAGSAAEVETLKSALSQAKEQAKASKAAADKAAADLKTEQVAHRLPSERVEPSPAAMFTRVMAHVASLAECSQIAWCVVGGVMVQMRTRDIDPRDAHDRRHVRLRRTHPATAPVAPLVAISVPPASVTQVEHPPAVRALAMLAAPLGAAEPDQPRQLRPVDRVEPAMFGHDRHDDSMSQPSRERKQKIG